MWPCGLMIWNQTEFGNGSLHFAHARTGTELHLGTALVHCRLIVRVRLIQWHSHECAFIGFYVQNHSVFLPHWKMALGETRLSS